ncbi:site-specific integrase [Lacimicrobium sp. SS2-24]|uniref:site-specific integrase n=1 Tax=Lacimicrobium sp. SS2-24 TaxID=2005569 RepID=UPI000B4B2819|nr:site-specific integrase [Lacimicrobium sp. SS2-24]
MHNLVTNQYGVYTYRRTVQGHSIRVSLLTKDKLEALRVVEHINTTLSLVYPLRKCEAVKIVHAALHRFQPIFQKQRMAKVQQYLGLDLSQDTGELISVVVEKYIEEKLRTKAWAEKTYLGYKVIYQNLITLLNDKCIRSIGAVDAQRVKSDLQKLPANLNKKAEYRGKPINRVLKMDIPASHLMSIKTINTMLGCYSELFKWAVKNGYSSTNVFDGMLLKDTRKARDLRQPFTPADLKHIFSDIAIRNPNKSWHKWLPVLGLYTGARLNELCQLQRKDILKVDGCWCISINDEGTNQILKSVSSKRVIPIHEKLLSLGFIDYVNSAAPAPNSMVFPDLKLLNERYSHTPSRWFSNIKNRVLDDSGRKSFHSFRHTFVDYLYNKLKLQGNPLVKALLGHSDSEITSGVYGSSFVVEDLDQIVQSVDFDSFGFSVND